MKIRIGFNAGLTTNHMVALVQAVRSEQPHLELRDRHVAAHTGDRPGRWCVRSGWTSDWSVVRCRGPDWSSERSRRPGWPS